MPIPNYSVLAGKPISGKVVTGRSPHYQITMQATGGPFTVAINIQSVDGSEVLYAIEENFTPPNLAALLVLPAGMTPLPSALGGLAIDFVRDRVNGTPIITRQQMTLLPQFRPAGLSEDERMLSRARSSALQNAVVTLLNMTIADNDGIIYAFGSAYADSGRVDGIHNIHMNQGNPAGPFERDNGAWQDGAIFIHLPAKNTWTAIFIAFQSESWNTDDSGNPTTGSRM